MKEKRTKKLNTFVFPTNTPYFKRIKSSTDRYQIVQKAHKGTKHMKRNCTRKSGSESVETLLKFRDFGIH